MTLTFGVARGKCRALSIYLSIQLPAARSMQSWRRFGAMGASIAATGLQPIAHRASALLESRPVAQLPAHGSDNCQADHPPVESVF